MRTRSRNPFTTVTTAGLLLPVDLLSRIVEGDPDLPGLTPKDYHLHGGERLNEAASRAWNQCQAAWKAFRKKFAELPASDAGTTVTRDEWLLPLFQELGYGRLQTKPAIKFEEKEYPVSHGWENHVPIHLLSARYPLDRRTPGVAGAATRSPYSMVQELLNRSGQHRWGFLSNGLKLFVLRDNAALARAANVEFDLEAMMEGEVYADFILLFLLCHQSRVEILPQAAVGGGRGSRGKGGGKSTARQESDDEEGDESETETEDEDEDEDRAGPATCWLEIWSNQADQQGTRAREKLRDGVEAAIKSLGAGFLTTKGNTVLRDRLRSGGLSTQDYYRQLLRLVYRLLMLLVAEEKKTESGDNLLHPPGTTAAARDRYTRFYSVGRIRTLAYERRGTSHTDLYASLKVLFLKLREGYSPLGIPGMGSFLFPAVNPSTPDLDGVSLANQHLLDAFRHLCYTEDTTGHGGAVRRPVDFGNLGSEELGSVYESLLELHPQIDTDEGPFTLGTAAGHERKTTGSYYTPTSLINCLLDSALDPVVAQAIDVSDPKEAEKALLNLKVCDPACGSGHFLIAAAGRIATHLARLRTGDDQPATLDVQHAKRDIIGRCIYGVDLNPMAVELCKVSLWMEALEPGKPLSFLDHHIQCGNSLLGTTPKLLADGLPDDAFKPIAGDDDDVCTAFRKDNKRQRAEYKSGQKYLFKSPHAMETLPSIFDKLSIAEDSSLAALAEKERHYAELTSALDYQNLRMLADTWCAAFVWTKDTSNLGQLCPTERDFRQLQSNPHEIIPQLRSEVRRLADHYRFVHWHLMFPNVFRLPRPTETAENEQTGWNGGFDVVLGNPPWETLEFKEKEWFAVVRPDIAGAPTTAKRRALIARLREEDASLFQKYQADLRTAEGIRVLIRSTGRFPLCATGKINTYSIFAETNRQITQLKGRVGCIVQSGIASDDTTKHFFDSLMSTGTLVSLFDFENSEGLFPGVHREQKFSLLTMAGSRPPQLDGARFAFFQTNLHDIDGSSFVLSGQDILRINPNTRTCPIFRRHQDAVLTREIYSRHPVLSLECSELKPSEWSVGFRQGLFNMSLVSDEFVDLALLARTRPETTGMYMPIYEGKLTDQFDHRCATFDSVAADDVAKGNPRPASLNELQSPTFGITPRWFLTSTFLDEVDAAKHTHFLTFHRVANPNNVRSAIFTIVPRFGVSDSLFLVQGLSPCDNLLFCALGNSFVFDYITRLKVGSRNFSFFTIKQIAVPRRSDIQKKCGTLIRGAALELTYTAWDLEPFALDCGYLAPPFRWDDDRRFLLRCELDAALFHLYFGRPEEWGRDNRQVRDVFAMPRDAVDYVMGTFPIVRRRDEEAHSEYRTKRVILEIYDEMAEAIRTGRPYQTRLDPPSGPPTDADGNFIPVGEWDATNWPPHIHVPREK